MLGKSQQQPRGASTAAKVTVIKAAKLTDEEAEKVDLVKKMLGTDNTSEALRWCIRAAWATYGEQVEEIVKKKESVSPINL